MVPKSRHISAHFRLTVTLRDKIYLPYLFTVTVLMKNIPMGNGHVGIRKIGYFRTKRQIVDWRMKVRIFNEDMDFEILYCKHRYYKMNMDTKPWRKYCLPWRKYFFTWYKKLFFGSGFNSSWTKSLAVTQICRLSWRLSSWRRRGQLSCTPVIQCCGRARAVLVVQLAST